MYIFIHMIFRSHIQIILYLIFLWSISRNIIISRFIHVIINSITSLLFVANIPLYSYNVSSLRLLFSHYVSSDSSRPHGLQHDRLPCPSLSPRVCSDSCPLSQWCYPIVSSPAAHSLFAFNLSQHQGVFKWVSSLHQVAKVLEFHLQHQSSLTKGAKTK